MKSFHSVLDRDLEEQEHSGLSKEGHRQARVYERVSAYGYSERSGKKS